MVRIPSFTERATAFFVRTTPKIALILCATITGSAFLSSIFKGFGALTAVIGVLSFVLFIVALLSCVYVFFIKPLKKEISEKADSSPVFY